MYLYESQFVKTEAKGLSKDLISSSCSLFALHLFTSCLDHHYVQINFESQRKKQIKTTEVKSFKRWVELFKEAVVCASFLSHFRVRIRRKHWFTGK